MAKAEKKAADQASFNFDLEAMEAEIAKVKEKHLGGAKARLADLEAQQAAIGMEIERLQELLGIATKPKAARAAGTRMKRDEKAKYEANALAYINGSKDGVSRSQVAERLGLEPSQAATILKALKEDGKVKTEGDKAATKYFSK